MKPTTKILLYDDYCPLCTWYSSLFVKCGLLNPENRVAFSKADLSILTAIDIEKGKDEIPLFDPSTRQTLYGIDSLLEILGQRLPLIKTIGNCKPVKWFLTKLYKLVSYNRKVIVARKCGPGTFDCSPGFNTVYRNLFLVIFLLFNTVMLIPIHNSLLSNLSFYHLTGIQLQVAHFAFVSVNCVIALFFTRKMALEFLGQVNVLALVSILLLSVLTVLDSILHLPEWTIVIYLFVLTLFIIKEYFRRMRYASIIPSYKPVVAINIICLSVFLGYVFL